MPDFNKGRYSRNISVYDPNDTTERRHPSATSAHIDEKTLQAPSSHPLLNEDATIQVPIRVQLPETTRPAAIVDEAATTVLNRQDLFAEAARLDNAAHQARNIKQQQMLEQTFENPRITDYLPSDIRPTIAMATLSEKTIADQEIVHVGAWREFIVEVDDQMCLIVPIEIARSGLLRPGRRLVARIRALDE